MMPLQLVVNKLLNLNDQIFTRLLCTPQGIMSERIISGAGRRAMRRILSSKSAPRDYYKGE